MIGSVCERERNVLDAIAANRWPDRLDGELSAHVAACAICRDLATVAGAIAEDYGTAFEHAHLPSAGLVWWRAEIRARQQAIRAAERPITLIQTMVGVCGVAAALGLLAWAGFNTREIWEVLANQPVLLPLLYVAIGVLVLLGSVALFLALSDE
jgi:hypothetical protein